MGRKWRAHKRKMVPSEVNFLFADDARCYAQAVPSRKRSKVPLYVRIAETFTRQVATGVLRPGDRVPSLRKLSREQGVSLSTALQAYVWLENRGYLEARPQSGFYVRTPYAKLIPEPQAEMLQSRPIAM